MKHQQVLVDYWTMFKTSFLCLFLAFAGYILIKMVQTIFWLPAHLKRNQQRLEQLAAQYSLEMNRGIENGPCNANDDDNKEPQQDGSSRSGSGSGNDNGNGNGGTNPLHDLENLDDIDAADKERLIETKKLLDEIAPESKKGK